ncbi:MAG: 50S ribosomal protein L10, partial [Candidatus Kariarchaeaceae archaeon]
MSLKRPIPKRKMDIVNQLKELLESHNTIGIVQMESIAAGTVQKLRSDLNERAKIVVSKNTLMRKA